MSNPNSKPSALVSDGVVIKSTPPAMFSDVELRRPETASVYENRGGKSTVAINAVFTVLSCGFSIAATVYARLGQDGNVRFDAALPKGVAAKDEHRDAFRGHINAAIGSWSGRQRAFTEAYERLTNAKPAGKSAASASIVWKPGDESVSGPAAETAPAESKAA